MAHVLTLSLNPALDLAIRLPRLVPGEVNRTRESHLEAAGKGVNVARVLVTLGHQVTVSGFLGDTNDGLFVRAFEALGAEDAFIRVPGETRINAKVAEDDGRVTDINGSGLAIPAEAWSRLVDWLDELAKDTARRPDAVIIAGSLPPGITAETQAGLIRRLREQGMPVWADTSGPALSAAIEARPTAVKPNEHELADWAGEPLDSDDRRLAAAYRLHAAGIEEALISAGASGVLWVSQRGAWLATPPTVTVESTVGAGDTLVAGLLHGILQNETPERILSFATALSAESVRHVGVGDAQAADFTQLLQQTRVLRLDEASTTGALT
ncbi:1-phosphofructokinase [Litchfieldella xinjiangensis]|uniref:1-phosphofructokinase n=1 Tax=Litchfieldella xinjiangensis TaxID=1166948 RepID=UPI0005BA19BA|nr:1-phosphofructokinase [Halomonas xinjiangensis]